MNRVWVITLLQMFQVGAACAGETLSLKDVLLRAQEKNFDIRLAASERDAAQGDANKSNSVFLPQISASASFAATNDPLNVFGFKLKQSSVTQSDFNPVLLNAPDRIDNYSMKIEAKQPLINLDGFFGRTAAQDALKAVEQKEVRTRQYVTFEAKSKYYDLVLARQSVSVISVAFEAAQANLEQAKNYFDQGMIRESDYLFAKVRVLELESKLTEAENAVHNAEGALKFVIGSEESGPIIPLDTLSFPAIEIDSVNIPAINERRADMLAMEYGVDASSGIVRMHQFKFFPSVNAFGSYEWNDRKLFGRNGTSWIVGAMMKWDIFTGFDQIGGIQKAEANRERAKTELEKARSVSRNDIEMAFRNRESASRRVALAREAVQQASENYRILSDRYASGLEKTTDLLSAEAALANARLTLLQALYASNIATFMIDFLTEL
jgi:outer membrane protein TolC